MITWDDQPHWAEYRHFRLSSESDNFRLHVAGFVPGGNAGDSLTSAWDNDHNGQQFSTHDRSVKPKPGMINSRIGPHR